MVTSLKQVATEQRLLPSVHPEATTASGAMVTTALGKLVPSTLSQANLPQEYLLSQDKPFQSCTKSDGLNSSDGTAL